MHTEQGLLSYWVDYVKKKQQQIYQVMLRKKLIKDNCNTVTS